MTDADPWASLEEIEYAHHLTVWFAVFELEGDSAVRINSGTVREELHALTGEIRTTQSVLTSMYRLLEAGVLERKELEERSRGYDWRTTERGRRIAEAFVGEWDHVLKPGEASNSEGDD